jgi:hypothetical protein
VTTGWLVLTKNDNKKQFKLQISIQEIAQFQLISVPVNLTQTRPKRKKKTKIKREAFHIVIQMKNVAGTEVNQIR